MVVVSGTWVKNVVSFPINGDLITTVKMAAKAVLICRPNSHPFQERTLSLDQPVKIGRSVARARAVPNNAIFDCKVLSRNHALLWYENGKFYLQDTKSSNGTFVNNQRLSKGAEESPPREVCSGDIVQFGVDVMENARKVTHGCIVATVKLYLPDGKEAKASPSTSVVSSVGLVPLEDLYQLNIYLQEALQREQMLETKLSALQKIVEATRQSSEQAWKALIDEDRLLSRVETLENQLQTSSKNFGEDKLREEIRKLLDDKDSYQVKAKGALQKILQEKLEAVLKLQALESSLSNSESECTHLKQLCAQGQQDLQELAQKFTAQVQKVEELTTKLQENEEQNKETADKLEQEKLELQHGLEVQTEQTQVLQLRLDAVQADGDLNHQRMADLNSQLQLMKSNEENVDDYKVGLDHILNESGHKPEVILQRLEPTLSENEKSDIEDLRYKLKSCESELQSSRELVVLLQTKLDGIRTEEDNSVEEPRILQQRLEVTKSKIEKILDMDTNKCADGDTSASEFAALEAERKELMDLLEAAREKKNEVDDQKEALMQELNTANTEVKKLTEEVNTCKQQLLSLENRPTRQEVAELQTMLQQTQSSLAMSQSSLAMSERAVMVLQEKVCNETLRAKEIEAQKQVVIEKLTESVNNANQLRQETVSLNLTLKVRDEHFEDQLHQEKQRRLKEVQLYETHLDDVQNTVAALKSERDSFRTKVTNLELREQELLRRLEEAGVPPDVHLDQLEEELVQVKTNFTAMVAASERIRHEFEAYRVSNPVRRWQFYEVVNSYYLNAVAFLFLVIGLWLFYH